MKEYIIKEDLLIQVVQYMLGRPMGEIEGLVYQLRTLPPANDVAMPSMVEPEKHPA